MNRFIGLMVLLLGAQPPDARGAPVAPAFSRLQRAVQAYSTGRYQLCAELAAGLEDSDLLNPDTALFLSAQCRFYAGQFVLAGEGFMALKERFPESAHFTAAAYRLADCDWERGARERAAKTYAALDGVQSQDPIDRAVGLFRRAMWDLQRGTVAQGQRLWLALLKRHPDHPLASLAPPGHAEPPIDFDNALAISRSLHGARRWMDALALLDSLSDPGSDARRARLAYRNGRILFDMRFHYEQAASLLLAARDHAPSDGRREEAWLWASRALGRADRENEAIASHLAMVARYPKGKHAARALYYAGWLAHNQNDCPSAQRYFERTIQAAPNSTWATQATWFSAWCHLQTGDHRQALRRLAGQVSHPDWHIGARAAYWSGMAQKLLAENDQAERTWRKLLSRYPLTWYALLARTRLGPEAPGIPPPPRARAARTERTDLQRRSGELARAGFQALARQMVRARESAFRREHPGLAGLVQLMDLYRQLGDCHRPWVLTELTARGSLARLPTKDTRAIWDHAYPACEREYLKRFAGADRPLMLLLQSIMRSESGFDPLAHSIADARGLMQLIPPVAEPLANRLGLDYSPVGLFEPELNVHIATVHIGGLARRFDRCWPLVAAAYNADPEVVESWIARYGEPGLDWLVESIPYAETRNYAMDVTTALARYLYLEGDGNLSLSLDVPRPRHVPSAASN